MVIPLREGSEQEHRVLDVRHGVGAGVLRREHPAGFLCGHSLFGDGKEQRPLPSWADADHLGSGLPRHTGDGETAHPAGGSVIGMVFAAGSFPNDLGIGPLQAAEVIGQGDAGEPGGGGRTAAFADRDLVVNSKRQGNDLLTLRQEDVGVGFENKVILEVAADFLVASGDSNGEGGGWAGLDRDVKIHRQGSGVEGRPQIG